MKHNSIKRCAATQISAFDLVQINASFNLFFSFWKLLYNFHAPWGSEDLFGMQVKKQQMQQTDSHQQRC